jgi:sec-independent protein translocase protein TatA
MSTLFAIGMPGATELIIIFVILLVMFGAKKIPELARSMGKATKEFKEAKSAFNEAIHSDPEPPKPPQQIAPPAEEEKLQADVKEDVSSDAK